MRRIKFLIVGLLIMPLLISCVRNDALNDRVGTADETVVETENAETLPEEEKAQNGGDPDETDVSQEEDTGRIVEGRFDITYAVSGIALKDAFRDYFRMGVGINGNAITNASVRSEALNRIKAYHFNSTTYTNLMKPDFLLYQQGSISNYQSGNPEPALRFDSIIEGMEFCVANNINMRGHVLIWHNQVPEWLFREGYQQTGDFVDRETMLNRMRSYIRQVLEFTQTNYPGVITCWDVVNEAVAVTAGGYETQSGFYIRTTFGENRDNLWYKVIGADYFVKAFEFARRYAGADVKLFYNDYNTFQPVKTERIFALISHLKELGLIDGIGMQGHMGLDYPGISAGNHNIKAAIERFAQLGLEIQITELSINSGNDDEISMQRQADRYEELFRLLTQMDTAGGGPANITSVTVFGLMDRYLFYPADRTFSRLFDGRLQPKPSFRSVMSVVE